MIEEGKRNGDVRGETDSREAAESIWLLLTGISGMLASHINYKYQDGLKTMMYGVNAILAYMNY